MRLRNVWTSRIELLSEVEAAALCVAWHDRAELSSGVYSLNMNMFEEPGLSIRLSIRMGLSLLATWLKVYLSLST
jgi:hypothetical protein